MLIRGVDTMIEYFRCPYCTKFRGGLGKSVPKTIGKYRVKVINDVVLIFQCLKCLKTFRVMMVGKPLLWYDMSPAEKSVFKQAKWIKRRYKEDGKEKIRAG